MANDDFDINFDFDKEYDFDPKILSGDGEIDEDIDLSQFSDEELGLKPQDDDASLEDSGEDPPDDGDFDLDFDIDEFLDTDGDESDAFPDEGTSEDVPEFAKRDRASRFHSAGYGVTPDFPADAVPSDLDEEPPVEEDLQEEAQPEEPVSDTPEPIRRRRERSKPKKAPRESKPAAPNIFTKFFDLYFAPVLHKELLEEPKDPNAPRRRRKSKLQIFKEAYLPALVVCLCLILVLSFAIGALSNFIKQHNLDKEAAKSHLEASVSAAQQAETDSQIALEQAKALAAVYNYDDAITALDNFLTSVENASTDFPELTAIRSEYVTAKSQLVSHQDPSLIPNLSFHVLVHDMAKAKQSEELGGKYNRNFVTTSEFTKILGELYNNGYVLVDFNSFTTNSNGTILPKNINLPEGKKPIMLTETLVNYFEYMVDHNKDGQPDADGDGFANKLVVDANGDIKAEYVDNNGNTLVGDYDLVPILETFLKEHPDFSYQGARAILAVTGSEGIFGYRINSSYTSRGDSYREDQIAGATKLVNALREKGYTLACNTYENKAYGQLNANQITTDLQQWAQQITPVIGNVDVIVYAQESDIADYSGNAFTVMSTSGFRYFVGKGASPSTEVNTNYVHQKRLMVTGNSMAWNQAMFNNIFDPNSVIDMATRVSVPNG